MKKIFVIIIPFLCFLSLIGNAIDQLDHKTSIDSECQEILVLQCLAETQHHFNHVDFKQAYENSKKALYVLNFFEEDRYKNLDSLFLALYQHTICCDQLDFTEECDTALNELLLVSDMIVESCNNCCEYEDMDLMFFETVGKLYTFAGLAKNEHIKKALITTSKRIFLEESDTSALSSNQVRKPSDNPYSLNAKKLWHRSFSWWKKQIKDYIKKTEKIVEILDKLNQLYDWIMNNN